MIMTDAEIEYQELVKTCSQTFNAPVCIMIGCTSLQIQKCEALYRGYARKERKNNA